MTATPVAWKVELYDMTLNALGSPLDSLTGAEIINPQFGSVIDGPGSIHLELRPGTTFINHVIDAWGGPSWDGPIKAYFLRMSQDNGVTWPTGAWLKKGSVDIDGDTLGVTIDQADLIEGYSLSYIDDATYISVRADQILGAANGGIQVNSANIISASPNLPAYWHGLFDHTPGRKQMEPFLKMSTITNPEIGSILADTALNSDSILNTAANVVSSVSGVYDPSHPERFGAYQHTSFDIRNMIVRPGYRGITPIVSVTDAVTPGSANELTQAAIVDADTIKLDIDLSTYFAQMQVECGSSTHGMPDGGTFTGVVIVNKPASGASTTPFDNLIVVSITTAGGGGGGMYYYLGDGYLRKMSQAMDANGIFVDGTTGIMYSPTRIGLFQRVSTGPYTSAAWTRVGDATLEFTKAWAPSAGTIYAIASGSNNDSNNNGVWRWTLADGWKRAVGLTNIVDASGGDSALYYTDTTAPSKITWTTYPSTGTKPPIDGTGGAHIVGMDFNTSGNVIVRTELGALGMYTLFGGVMSRADPGGTLADSFGPLAVSRFISYVGTINGKAVDAFAVTDRGIWWRSAPGGAFNPTDGQSGLQDVQGTWIDVGAAQTVMGRVFTPLVVVTDKTIYISRDGGLHWSNEMVKNVDALVAWYEIIKAVTGQYPSGDMGAFGSFVTGAGGVQSPTDPEGNGTIVIVPAGSVWSLPPQWVCARRWTDNGGFTCRLVDTQSMAPYNAMRLAEASDIIADDSRSVVDASEACLVFMFRALAQASKPQTALQLTVAANTQEAKIHFAINGDLVSLTLHRAYTNWSGSVTTTLVDFDNKPMYIVAKQCRTGDDIACLYDLTLVNNTTYRLLDFTKVIAALANGQAKDRRLRRTRIR